MKKYNILKNAGVLLIVMVMVLSTVIVTAMNNRSVILYEGFEDGVMPPAGWTVFDYGEEGWWINSESFSGENAAYWTGSVASELITYTIDTTAMTEAYLSFWHKQPSTSKGQDTLSIMIDMDGGAWLTVADYSDDISSYTHEMIDLTAYVGGTLQAKFTATGGGGDGVYLDEIRLCEGYTTEFMGLEVAPLGIAELEIIDTNLSISNCNSGDPETDGVWVNIEDTYNQWDCHIENPDYYSSQPIGATINIDSKGIINGEPDQTAYRSREVKVDDDEWEVYFKSEATSYTIFGISDDEIIYVDEIDVTDEDWILIGSFTYIREQPQILDYIGYTAGSGKFRFGYSWHGKITWKDNYGDPIDDFEIIIIKWTNPGTISSNNKISFYTYQVAELIFNDLDVYINDPSDIPVINGQTNGKAGTEYDYTFSATDPDNDDVYYCIDWGDETDLVYIGPYPSGETVTVSHTWAKQGDYIIKSKSYDSTFAESDWGTLEITMPRNRAVNNPFFKFLEQHPILYQLLQRFLQI